MWRSPTTPPDETARAGRPRRSRWLDIVNLAVSILILAIFVRMIPLLTAGSGVSVNELAARVENLERSVSALQAQVSAPQGGASLELLPVDAAGFQGLGRFAGFSIRNDGTDVAANVRVFIAFSGISPAWASALTRLEQIVLRTFPASLAVSVSKTTSAPTVAGAAGEARGEAIELAMVALPPGRTVYVAVGLSPELAGHSCVVSDVFRARVQPSRFAPPGLPAASLDALQISFARQARTALEQHARIAKFAAWAICDNCKEPSRAAEFILSALVESSFGNGVPALGQNGILEWTVDAKAEFYSPAGMDDWCGDRAQWFSDPFAFISSTGHVYRCDFEPAEAPSASR